MQSRIQRRGVSPPLGPSPWLPSWRPPPFPSHQPRGGLCIYRHTQHTQTHMHPCPSLHGHTRHWFCAFPVSLHNLARAYYYYCKIHNGISSPRIRTHSPTDLCLMAVPVWSLQELQGLPGAITELPGWCTDNPMMNNRVDVWGGGCHILHMGEDICGTDAQK